MAHIRNIRRNHKEGTLLVAIVCIAVSLLLMGRLAYLMIIDEDYYNEMSEEQHTRERSIKAARGTIYDRNGVVLATNKTVCTISVIYNQIEDPEEVIEVLCRELTMDEETVRAKVEKYTSREIIRSNVDKETGDRIRSYDLAGVKVDEDYKRYYPYGDVASKILGFCGSDNQGIIGLEVMYDDVLKGTAGSIATITDAKGMEIDGAAETRVAPVDGADLYLSIDINIQEYAQQAAEKVLEEKQAKQVSIIIMDPNNGEILAFVNVPEFDLNAPYDLNAATEVLSAEEYSDLLNEKWRNTAINDTYEPGSAFKIITMAAALEENVVSLEEHFSCGGYYIVEDRRIHCHKRTGHGGESFVEAAMNSCNPVFIQVGLRLGVDRFYGYFGQLGLLDKTGVDLPGEAGTIMHKPENMGEVELATVSFGQSFQLTPLRLLTTVSGIINGGTLVTPHFAVRSVTAEENEQGVAETSVTEYQYETTEGIISGETSQQVKYICEQVVLEGGGSKGAVEGYSVGGKTATSQKLPRSAAKYIASFIGFVPADNPQIVGIITIDEPQGVYYGGTIAAPVLADIYENILPYLEIPAEDN